MGGVSVASEFEVGRSGWHEPDGDSRISSVESVVAGLPMATSWRQYGPVVRAVCSHELVAANKMVGLTLAQVV
jgi:hypothetical protein